MPDKKEKLFPEFLPVSTQKWEEVIAADLKRKDMKKFLLIIPFIGILFMGANRFSKENPEPDTKVKDARATSVYIMDNDVYIAGYQQYEPKKETSGKPAKKAVAQDLSFDEQAQSYYESTQIIGTLWKNGVAQNLSDGSNHTFPLSVFASDADVYVAGFEDIRLPFCEVFPGVYLNARVAKLWKNGVAQNLSKSNGKSDAIAYSVFVSGNDIYAAGYENIKNNKQGEDSISVNARLWKNGVVQESFSFEGIARSVFVSGNDVFVVGDTSYKSSTGEVHFHAVLWKNGVAQNLNVDGKSAIARSVYILNGDVYVAGNALEIIPELQQMKTTPVLWKNGIAQYLSTGNDYDTGTANSVCISEDGDVYVMGFAKESGSSREIAVLWKNGIVQTYEDYGYFTFPGEGITYNAVSVSGNDVYVTGREKGVAVFWKNGVEQALTEKPDISNFVVR